ncbi:glycoside hydrolase family 104 protein [Jeongeupia naejangsanensis]|uniref:Glycoside hydrolase family 104 protein n=1 Tax=Jeongeupia naejangsanensis TaxID=613195 RepID=A0ABS2BHP6_9NEIS|nr:glycoside hydrolase family 104 protein [Jeongeupia naejangsanensis]MBM3114995.1 glycoside hydrolase family 104 protein [Jeongeupia naejangsanensis]
MARISITEAGGANVLAFLDMLAASEGTASTGDDGYNVIVGSTPSSPKLFDNYADHPRVLVNLPKLKIKSSAAGRYQILGRYYSAYSKQLRLSNFSPLSQDRIALQLIRECKALDDIKQGNIERAIHKCRSRWASLPGAGYGQHENKLKPLLDAYHAAGGTSVSAPMRNKESPDDSGLVAGAAKGSIGRSGKQSIRAVQQPVTKNNPSKLSELFGNDAAPKRIAPLNGVTSRKLPPKTKATGASANGLAVQQKGGTLSTKAEQEKQPQINTEASAQYGWADAFQDAIDTAIKDANKVGIDSTGLLGIDATPTIGLAPWNFKKNKSAAGSGGLPSLSGSSNSGIRGGGANSLGRNARRSLGTRAKALVQKGKQLAQDGFQGSKNWLGQKGSEVKSVATRGRQMLHSGMRLGKGLLGTVPQALRSMPNLALNDRYAPSDLNLRALPTMGNDAIGDSTARVLAFFGNHGTREAPHLGNDQAPKLSATGSTQGQGTPQANATLPSGSQTPQKITGQIDVKVSLPQGATGTVVVNQPVNQGVQVKGAVGYYMPTLSQGGF